MYIERVLSINGGWSILTTQKTEEWHDIQTALNLIQEDTLVTSAKERESGDKSPINWLGYFIPNYFSSTICNKKVFNWEQQSEGLRGGYILINDKPFKNGVIAYICGFNEYSGGNFSNNFYINNSYYYNTGQIELAVILVLTTEAKEYLINSGINTVMLEDFPTEESCREQLAELGFINSKVPVLLAFCSFTSPSEIIVEESIPLKTDGHTLERTIEFAPEYYQAGVGLLSYFGEVLRQKDPSTTAKIRIEQAGTIVRLHIESVSGEIETIEKELEKFALVISSQLPPESLFENRAHIIKLENKLAVTQMEVKHEQDMRQLTDGLNSQRINSLEQLVASLQHQLSSQLLQTGQVIHLANQQATSPERLQTALLSHSQNLFTNMLQEATGNQVLADAVYSLQRNLLSSIAAVDMEDQIERSLAIIQQEKPGFLSRMLTEFKGAAYKASTSSALAAAVKWLSIHQPLQ